MNKTWVRALLAGLGALVMLAVGAGALGLYLAQQKMQRRVEPPVQPVAYRSDTTAIERGKYLFASRGCVECHGSTGTGRVFVEEANGLRIAGPNITTGAGGMVAAYQPVDWVRSIRHGVNPQGRALMIMPSEDYNRFTDDDLASLVAYVRSLPPGAGRGAIVELPLPVRVLYGFGLIKDAAARIDHSLPPQQPVPEGATAAHGQYVANMCLGCHGEALAGGKIPGGPPDWPPAANLTPGEGSVMGRYPDADALIAMFRSGKRPDGSAIPVMPFGSLREMSETDLRALYLHLKALPPRPHG
ncbi:c-type cytochrome [Hydrogenophaga sp. PBL-H3]|uniref:c-type cytochrome n=1 Tax=Hydrogenophaga sp. PBL-H3 TaxID=434010 RepID=UPI00131F5D4B|nr:cytochrome c [Hydrogenophaga sp. PBL-H3]QHE75064.1 c-type cytochrome [Hydrogenophaga sp. PBL-H3]QHE79491.1 c-type cytochrome [Hydrogenophaga sp. PBL-H3]